MFDLVWKKQIVLGNAGRVSFSNGEMIFSLTVFFFLSSTHGYEILIHTSKFSVGEG